MKEVFCEREGSCERSCERASRLFFFRSIVSLSSGSGDQVMAVVEVWLRRSKEWCESFGVFLFSGVRGFGCLKRDYCWELFFFDVAWSDWLV